MNARYATSAIAVLLAVIVGYLAYLDLHTQEELQNAQRAFSNIYKSSLYQIGIATKDQKAILKNLSPIKKDIFHAEPLFSDKVPAENWQLITTDTSTPSVDPLNDFLTSIVSLSYNVRIPSELIKVNEEGLGFGEPTLVITIKHARGEEVLRIGKLHPHGDKRYATITGQSGVYLIPARIVEEALAVIVPLKVEI